jgi:hypothetical protein
MMQFKKLHNRMVECTSNGSVYVIDTENMTCTCKGYYFEGYKKKEFKCKHIKELLSSPQTYSVANLSHANLSIHTCGLHVGGIGLSNQEVIL